MSNGIPWEHGPVTIDRAAHTSPYRLSTVSGEKMNHIAGFENRQSQIGDSKKRAGRNFVGDYKFQIPNSRGREKRIPEVQSRMGPGAFGI